MKRTLAATIALLTLLSAASWAQKSGLTPFEKQTAYEGALLDSTYRYELLKPTFFSLKSAYESQTKEVAELRTALHLSALQNELQKQNFEAEIRKARESGGFWKGFKWGFGTGFGTGFLTGLSAQK
jgi:hypothetical protein